MKRLYLLLALAGWALPCYFFASFLVERGLELPLLFGQLFGNDTSTLFAVGLILTAVAFVFCAHREAARLRVRNWWVYAVATLSVGPSLALPLFLYFRAGTLTEEA